MTNPKITVVAGPAGAGKTTWIAQQIANSGATRHVSYFSPGTGNVHIDQTLIATKFPTVRLCNG